MKLARITAAACSVLLWGATVATAGNHLACYKVKDSLAKTKFGNVTLPSNTGRPTVSGCTIATGAKLCCDAVDKVGVPPQPNGGGPLSNTSKFCCYKAKCPKGSDQTITERDQFGTRPVVLSKSVIKYICAPASPSGAFLDDAGF